jgi:hypothetical protein
MTFFLSFINFDFKNISLKSLRRSIVILLPVFLFLYPYKADCQLRVAGEPASSTFNIPRDIEGMVRIPQPDLSVILQEDEKFPSPYRFGVVLPVDISPDHSGSWSILTDGTEIWRATVLAPGALALSAYFDKFHIPEGGRLFIYNQDKSMIIGAFTSLNNSESGLFSTELILGNEMTLEYVKPAGSGLFPVIHLNEVTYAYRGVEFLYRDGDSPEMSGKCEVNVNCPEGADWQSQKKGITRIHIKREGSTFWCTGSLVNNTNLDNVPYILTANHCGYNSTEKDLNQWVFYFDFESSECTTAVYPVIKAVVGAKLKAHSGEQQAIGSDFYLVRLNEEIPDTFHVFYNGWSRGEDDPSASGVGIHHPGGDLKKISTYKTTLESVSWMGGSGLNHWSVVWAQTISGHGVTEPGSSGSPLFDSKGRIVGFLSSGESSCDSNSLNLPDYYGKFSWAWASDGTDSTRRLKDWLDPGVTNLFYLDGRYTNSLDTIIPFVQAVFPNPFKEELTVTLKDIKNSLVHINIFDIPGRLMFTDSYQVNENGSFHLDLGFLPAGLYILRLESQETTISRKIVRQ